MIINKKIIKKCSDAASSMRTDCLKAVYNVGNTGAHIGGTLSMIEIMSVLYLGIMKYDINNLLWEDRDRFILSKGHGALAQYAAMKQSGLISQEEFLTFKKNNTFLYAHPSRNIQRGIEFSSGSLGQGVSLGVGVALALKQKCNKAKVFILVGDGECDEGSVWESLMSASQFKLDNIYIVVDKNNIQYDGPTDDIMSTDSLYNKFTDFGFETIETDGHDIESLLNAFSVISDKPKAIIANTIKGKGVSFMENNPLWHNGRLTEKQFNQAIEEQEVII